MKVVEFKCAVSGKYRVEHYDSKGRLKFKSEFQNLIVDQGLDRLAVYGTGGDTFLLLTDNTEPSESELGSEKNWDVRVGASVISELAGESPDWACSVTQRGTFTELSAPINISSVALGGWSNQLQNRTLFSRALILDSEGSPTTLSVLQGDTVVVYYTLFKYPPIDDVTGTITLGGNLGSSYDYIIRPMNLDKLSSTNNRNRTNPEAAFNYTPLAWGGLRGYTGDIGPLDGEPLGSIISLGTGSSTSLTPYVSGEYKLVCSWTSDTTSETGSFRCLNHTFGPFAYQTQFDPPIIKGENEILTLTYETSWARRE